MQSTRLHQHHASVSTTRLQQRAVRRSGLSVVVSSASKTPRHSLAAAPLPTQTAHSSNSSSSRRQQRYSCYTKDNSNSSSAEFDDAFRMPTPRQHQPPPPTADQQHAPLNNPSSLERAWAGQAYDSQLADEFFDAFKAPAQQQRGSKVFVFLRHGHSTWNEQSRIQGNTNKSELTALGRVQAMRARAALSDIHFDSCFSSPHTRARQTTEIVWQPQSHQHHQQQGGLAGVAATAGAGGGVVVTRSQQQQEREQAQQDKQQPPAIYLPSLSEVDLGWFQGLRNADIAAQHPELYRVWREEPERFELDGRYPVLDAFRQARCAWADMLSYPGSTHLVVTHKSLLRAMLCAALGLPPRQFRAIDLSNGAVCMVRCNTRGDLMLSANNLTSHLLFDDVRYTLPGSNSNDKLAAEAAGLAAATAAAVVNGSSGGSNGKAH